MKLLHDHNFMQQKLLIVCLFLVCNAAPTITLIHHSTTSATISWNHVPSNAVYVYAIQVTYSGRCVGVSLPTLTCSTTTSPFTVNSLEEFSQYTISVYAIYINSHALSLFAGQAAHTTVFTDAAGWF